MSRHTTYIQLTEDEYQRQLERAAHLGAQEALRTHAEHVKQLEQSLLLLRGLVDRKTMASAFDVSYDTIINWEKAYDWPRRELGQRVVYYWPDVVAAMRAQEDTRQQASDGTESGDQLTTFVEELREVLGLLDDA